MPDQPTEKISREFKRADGQPLVVFTTPQLKERPDTQEPHWLKSSLSEQGQQKIDRVLKDRVLKEYGGAHDVINAYDQLLDGMMDVTASKLGSVESLEDYNKTLGGLRQLAYASHSFDYDGKTPNSQKKYTDNELTDHHEAIKIVGQALKSNAPDEEKVKIDAYLAKLEKALFIDRTGYSQARKRNS